MSARRRHRHNTYRARLLPAGFEPGRRRAIHRDQEAWSQPSDEYYRSYELSKELRIFPEKHHEMIRVWNQELDMPIGVIGSYKQDHAMLTAVLDAETVTKHTLGGTLGMFIGGPLILREIVRLVMAKGRLVLGSSANITSSGQRFRVGDIEDEAKEAAGIIIDYGLQWSHIYGIGTTNVDWEHLKAVRVESCYELFYVARKYVELVVIVRKQRGPRNYLSMYADQAATVVIAFNSNIVPKDKVCHWFLITYTRRPPFSRISFHVLFRYLFLLVHVLLNAL